MASALNVIAGGCAVSGNTNAPGARTDDGDASGK